MPQPAKEGSKIPPTNEVERSTAGTLPPVMIFTAPDYGVRVVAGVTILETYIPMQCSVCCKQVVETRLCCKTCGLIFCKKCDESGRLVVPLFCCLCFMEVCDDCAQGCIACGDSACAACFETHMCEL